MVAAICCLMAGIGCVNPKSPSQDQALYVAPLPVQQARAYPETVTGRFVSLADFEIAAAGAIGQVEHFSFSPDNNPQAQRKWVVNTTRTGAGAMEVTLPAKVKLVYHIAQIHNFTGYSLLSVAIYSETLRDDLRLTVTSDASSWTSRPTLIQPGWNTVLVDIRRLAKLKDFDITGVRAVGLEFADAVGPVTFNVDDIMLVDNRRAITPAPKELGIEKNALDYELRFGGREKSLLISQKEDGLWRLDEDQAVVQLSAGGETLPDKDERLAPMGSRRVGVVEVVESNSIRVRLANTWYFPGRAGEWASLAVRKIVWEYTFYGDGRMVTHLEFNNAGGQSITSMRLTWPRKVAISGGSMQQLLQLQKVEDEIKRWDYLDVMAVPQRVRFQQNYLAPARIEPTIASDGFAPGDVDRDRFDESQGCYYLKSKAGHCRFVVIPSENGLMNPVFRVAGNWLEPPSVSSEGLAVQQVQQLADGSCLFMLSGPIMRATAVEVTGKVANEAASQ